MNFVKSFQHFIKKKNQKKFQNEKPYQLHEIKECKKTGEIKIINKIIITIIIKIIISIEKRKKLTRKTN